jgi:hypothetical protein
MTGVKAKGKQQEKQIMTQDRSRPKK